MRSLKITVILIIILLFLSTVTFFTVWVLTEQELKTANSNIQVNQINGRVLTFSRLLTDKVLSGDKEVSFEDRLKLENAVRDLNDQEVLSQWQEFTKSDSGVSSQKYFSQLLKTLLAKISY